MKMSNETGEEIILTFTLKNCEKNNYYQILINKDNENSQKFETEKCETKDGKIIFKNKMHCNFVFGTNQKFFICTIKSPLYSKLGDSICYERQTVLSSLVLSKKGVYERKIREAYNSELISIALDKSSNHEREAYLFDYFKLGIRLNCFLSFDFSKKGNAHVKKNNLNILKYLIERFIGFTNDQLFHVTGFGATSKTSPYYNHPVFKIGNSDSYNSDNIKIYDKNNLDNIIPDKKIILSPLLEKINHDINQLYKNFLYYVSFVLLSGDVDKCDQKNTIDKIIISSYLPLSIIIIGVGDHDFTEMNTFFNKEHKSSSRGIPRNKNNVIFTTIKSHSSTSEAISYCLKELSKQIIEFYQLIKYSPQNTEIINIENLKASQEIFGSVLNEEIIKEKDEKNKGDTDAIDMNKSNTSINSNNNYTNTGTPGDTPNHKTMYILKDSAAPPSASSSINEESNKSEKEEIKKDVKSSGETPYNSTNSSDIKQSSYSLFSSKNISDMK